MRRLLAGRVGAVAAVLSTMVSAVVSAGVTAGPANAAGGAQVSTAADDAEQALAEKFAPAVRLVHQDIECGPGEPYQPSDVALVLGEPSVALRGAWAEDDMIKAGPTAEDLGQGLFGYHLDFPGNPLEAGCDYEEWARAVGAGQPPTAYAHVTTEVGVNDRLALQYWFFWYPFNDWTNKHEGDWEVRPGRVRLHADGRRRRLETRRRSRSATPSTRAGSRSPTGTTRSSTSWTAVIPS